MSASESSPECKEDELFHTFPALRYEQLELNLHIDSRIPSPVLEWMGRVLLAVGTKSLSCRSYNWVALLMPSVMLMTLLEPTDNESVSATGLSLLQSLSVAAVKSLRLFVTDMWKAKAADGTLGLNELLIAFEVHASAKCAVPEEFHVALIQLLCRCRTLSAFASACNMNCVDCIRKLERVELKATDQRHGKKLFDIAMPLVVLTTHLARLHCLANSMRPTGVCSTTKRLCSEYDSLQTNSDFPMLFSLLVEFSNNCVTDHAFMRYKCLCLATHTATTLPATFAGFLTRVPSGESEASFDLCLKALKTDLKDFEDAVRALASAPRSEPQNQGRRQALRLLDNLCFLSTSLLVRGYDNPARLCTVSKIRDSIVSALNSLLQHTSVFNMSFDCISDELFETSYLTYDKYDKEKWDLHLMCGVFMLFWRSSFES